MNPKEDPYQERYLAHQGRKAQVLIEIMKQRHSNRMFANEPVPESDIQQLLETIELCPSSCDRHGVQAKVITERDDKALLGGILVGGVGWIHRAPAIILLFGDPLAYKAGDEVTYMPYLDAGVIVQQLSLAATAMGLHCAYANPNIRDNNKQFFAERFGSGIYCGAFAVGLPYKEEKKDA